MKNNQQYIEFSDVFFIGEQVRLFCPELRLCYDAASRAYVVLDGRGEVVLSTPLYPSQDIIFKLHKTKRENFGRLLTEIDAHNSALEQSRETAARDVASQMLGLTLAQAEKTGTGDLSRAQIQKLLL